MKTKTIMLELVVTLVLAPKEWLIVDAPHGSLKFKKLLFSTTQQLPFSSFSKLPSLRESRSLLEMAEQVS